jgi:chromosome partitioning protein
MAVITVLNQKGGVGKTSACHHLAGTLALMGRRVLLIDNDPQSSLTQGLWGPSKALSIDPAETIAAVYTGDAFPERVIQPSGIDGVDLVPGSVRSTRHNVPVPHEADWD